MRRLKGSVTNNRSATHIYADGRLSCIQLVGAPAGAFKEASSYV